MVDKSKSGSTVLKQMSQASLYSVFEYYHHTVSQKQHSSHHYSSLRVQTREGKGKERREKWDAKERQI